MSYHTKSNQLYNELLETKIIPEIEKESVEQLSVKELTQMTEKLEEFVQAYTKEIEQTDQVSERKKLRSKRKLPRQSVKKIWNGFHVNANMKKILKLLVNKIVIQRQIQTRPI